MNRVLLKSFLLSCLVPHSFLSAQEIPDPIFNREPLAEKPYTELPLGSIEARGWLLDELKRMAAGMTGHLDEWYPEVCGERNAWLGGDGDTWERGPYWIDGLYPLSRILKDDALYQKALVWINWTLENQREDGSIGPEILRDEDRTQPPPAGAQIEQPDDWWPRMVMLKILQQHYQATGDERVIDCLHKYFRYQLKTLPGAPLFEPGNEASGSWWAAQRGGDNLMVVLWLYNVTGEKYLLELADLIHKQTVPVTDWFSPGPQNHVQTRADHDRPALHCVNLAQMMKEPTIRWQQDQDARHLEATENAFADIRTFHGQPNGLYGGDEGMHGDAPDRGSELCSAVEMMFSLEKMFEITGSVLHGDRLERVAFNALPTQTKDDYSARQYFQQTNQVTITSGDRDFFEDGNERQVHGLLQGYPCCTCNLHQGWPKFTQHLWLATRDRGLAVLAYAPSRVSAGVADGKSVTLEMATGYPFKEESEITVHTDGAVTFPLHLRIPAWANGSTVRVNDGEAMKPESGTMFIVRREWSDGDKVRVRFPMPLRTSRWFSNTRVFERGPLVYALDIEEQWSEVEQPRPEGATGPHRGYHEVRPGSPWNYALPESVVNAPRGGCTFEIADEIPANPWMREFAPVRIHTHGIRLPDWQMCRNSAALPPLSPAERPDDSEPEPITLIPYGSTVLRITEFPWVRWDRNLPGRETGEMESARVTASHTWGGDTVEVVKGNAEPVSSADQGIRRWTSWPQRGEDQWIEIEFPEAREISSVAIYWFDDDEGVDLPKSWSTDALIDGSWQPLSPSEGSSYGTEADQFNTTRFPSRKVGAIRIRMTPRESHALGILGVRIR